MHFHQHMQFLQQPYQFVQPHQLPIQLLDSRLPQHLCRLTHICSLVVLNFLLRFFFLFTYNYKLQQRMDLNKLFYKIDNILGSTSVSINQISEAQQCLIYVASAYIIFYNPFIDQQIAYIAHSTPNINIILADKESKLLAVADKGKNPIISIYSIEKLGKQINKIQNPLYELKGHKNTVDILCFSPFKKYLLSISNYDGSMFLWQNGQCLTKNKMNKMINKAVFHDCGDLITIGRGYFKVWKFNNGSVIRKKQDDCWMMEGKVLTFGKNFSTKDFIDIGFYKVGKEFDIQNDKILIFSNDGFLCIMQSNFQKIQKWIDLSMQKSTSLQVIGNLALFTGDNALVKVVQLNTLTLQNKFPKPPPTNKENLSKDEPLQYNENEEFPQCLGVKKIGDYIATIYSNKTIFIWHLQQEAAAIRSIITHRGRIDSISLLQQIKGDITFFSTVCQDRTLRLWHFYKKQFSGNHQSIDIAEIIGIKRNVYCKNLTRIIYTQSEMPIYRMKMYQKDSIACISQNQFLLYSLDNFQLLLYHSFEEQFNKKHILSIEVYENLIYLGNQGGQIQVFRPQEQKLIKMKEIDMQMPIQYLQIFNKKILAYGKGRLKCIGLEGQTILNQYNIQCCFGSANYIVICQKKIITFYNIIKLRKTASINISHELDEHQSIKFVRSNSWLIVLLTNKNKFIVTNFSSIILYIEQTKQNINDYAVTEGGQIIIVTEGGTIIIKKQENSNNKYGWMDQKVKKWFEQNDMSWMDGSVWVSKSKSISQSSNNKQSFQLDSIESQNSIKLGNSYQPLNESVGFQHQLPNVALQYNNQQNKKSIFNPNLIGAQLNKIYNNVNEIMKNRKPSTNNNSNIVQIQKVDDIQQINLQTKTKSQKRRIFGQKSQSPKQYMPSFTNNLVQSVINKSKSPSTFKQRQNQGISTQDHDKVKNSHIQSSINFGFSNFIQQKQSKKILNSNKSNEKFNYTQSINTQQILIQEQNHDFLKTVEYILNHREQLLQNKQQRDRLILQHPQKFVNLYQILALVFKESQKNNYQNKVLKEFEQLSKQFISKIKQ